MARQIAPAEGHEARSAILLHSMYATFTDAWMAELWPFLAPIVNDTRAHFGLAAADSWAEVFARHDRILSVVPERFDAQVAARPGAMRSWGFLVPASHGTSTARWPAENPERLRVLVTLGTTYLAQERRLQDVLDALSDLDVAGIASTAGQVDIDDLRCPPNVEVHDFVDHASLLPECDLMITHAGLGSVAAALSHGVPLVCLPSGRDQHLNAERVEAVGAGTALGPDAQAAERITHAVTAVLAEPAYRAAAHQMEVESCAAGGASAAVADLETVLR